MAGTAQSDLYYSLVRRLGYAVGLEYLTERVSDVVDVFVAKGSLDWSDWRYLVQDKWQRKPSAERHIADVYSQLDIVRRQRNTIHPLPGLEALAVLVSTPNPVARDRTTDQAQLVRYISLLKVLEADGDIFLNALLASFSPSLLRAKLSSMIRHKRRSIAPYFPQAGSIRRLMDAISIRNQATEGTATVAKQTYAQKSRLLMSQPESVSGPNWVEQDIHVSDDYLEKICVTRRGWAEDFGLFERAGAVTTVRGEALISRLRALGMHQGEGKDSFFAFWPYPFQLARLGLKPKDVGASEATPWDLAIVTSLTMSDNAGNEQTSNDRQLLIRMLNLTFERFQSIGQRGVLRHELPLYIAEPVLAWWLVGQSTSRIDFRGFLKEELSRTDRRLDYVNIRGTEGGVRLMQVVGGGA